MQGGQLDRNARPAKHASTGGGTADGVDGLFVGVKIAFGVVGGQRRLAQHVEGMGVALADVVLAAGERGVDGFAHHELLAEQGHGEFDAAPDQRLPTPRDEPGQRVAQGRFPAGGDQTAGDHQPPGGGVDEQGFTAPEMSAPVALADFVADQAIHGGVVRNAQQRFGQAHQGDAFLAGQGKFMHQIVHPARALALAADGGHQPGGPLGDGARIERGGLDFPRQRGDPSRFVGAVSGGDRRAAGGERGGGIGGDVHPKTPWREGFTQQVWRFFEFAAIVG